MRRIGFLVLILAVTVCGLTALAAEKKNDGPWKLVTQSKINHRTTLAGFRDAKNGITVGYSGECHYTTDAGASWPNGTNFSACRFGLEIVNENVAWSCGNNGHVRMTENGGRTWQIVSNFGKSEPNHCRFLSFIDEKVGWIASGFALGMTVDGGGTWKTIFRPEGCGEIAAIELRTAMDGYILDATGLLFVTKDAGQTWTSIDSGFKTEGLMTDLAPQTAMRFVDADHGVIVTNQTDGKIGAVVTADGGKTWIREPIKDTMGNLYLSRDGRFLTVNQRKAIKVWQRIAD